MAVVIGKLLYIEEFFNPECRTIKFWFAAQLTGGRLDCTPPEAVPEHITRASSPTAAGGWKLGNPALRSPT